MNTADSRVEEGLVSAISLSIADQMGLSDDVMTSNVFVAVAPALASGSGDSKSGGRDGSVDYGRTESSETQPATLLLQQEMNRVLTMPSAETEADSRTEPDTTAPGSPQSPAPDVIRTTRNMREDSTAGTDVE